MTDSPTAQKQSEKTQQVSPLKESGTKQAAVAVDSPTASELIAAHTPQRPVAAEASTGLPTVTHASVFRALLSQLGLSYVSPTAAVQ